MEWNLTFFLNSVLLGLGLAMDAFSVSLANGMNEPDISRGKACAVAGVFAFFQALMPMLGWILVHTVVSYFRAFERAIPWIALVLLAFIGIKMIVDGVKNKGDGEEKRRVGVWGLLVQGVATSIDALSVGFTISNYGWLSALVCALIIAVITFALCVLGVFLGKKFGTKFSGKASILGGVILIAIGLEVFIAGII